MRCAYRDTSARLLHLLAIPAVIREDGATVRMAWALYERCLAAERIAFAREPAHLDELFRHATGDCYLLALSQALNATLVTLDSGLSNLSSRIGHPAILD